LNPQRPPSERCAEGWDLRRTTNSSSNEGIRHRCPAFGENARQLNFLLANALEISVGENFHLKLDQSLLDFLLFQRERRPRRYQGGWSDLHNAVALSAKLSASAPLR
jgi:hypothetical protein